VNNTYSLIFYRKYFFIFLPDQGLRSPYTGINLDVFSVWGRTNTESGADLLLMRPVFYGLLLDEPIIFRGMFGLYQVFL
jgi:hypothetical protein